MEVGSLSANRNLLIILLIILELAAGVVYFIYHYQPTQMELKELNAIVERKKREVREIEMTKRLLSEKRKEIERLKADIARLERFFPEEVFVPRVLVLLENLAEATHLKIQTIKPGLHGVGARPGATAPVAKRQAETAQVTPPAAPGAAGKTTGTTQAANPAAMKFDSTKEYKTIGVDFDVRGSFQNIYNFMNELTTFPKLVVVDTITMAPEGSAGKDSKGKSATRQNEPESGAYVELIVKMPLTFYIQHSKQPEF